MSQTVKVFAPASVGNVGCGFDVFGLAIDKPGDEIIVKLTDKSSVTISKITGDNGKLPLDPDKNTASVAIVRYLQHIHSKQGIDIELHKNMPLGSGLGSSAASAVAGVVAVNELMDKPVSKKDLLPFAIEGERVASGSTHADNVAPSLLGGFVLIRNYDPLDVIQISTPPDLICTVVHPQIEIRTEDARKILPDQIPLRHAIQQWSNTAGLIAGMLNSDYDLIGRSIQDVVVEPVRAKLIPGFYKAKNAALDAGAFGCSISGSGPSMFALNADFGAAEKIGAAMQNVFAEENIASEIYISKINQRGARVVG